MPRVAFAEDAEHHAPLSIRDVFRRVDSSDPDEPKLKYENIGGRWRAMGGGHLGLYGVETPPLTFAVSLSGFIELINMDELNPVPWETFRANVGLNTFWTSSALSRALLPPGGRLLAELGWSHESDHVSNERGFRELFLGGRPVFFDNANFSSYEYFKLRVSYTQSLGRVTTVFAVGGRAFTPSINPGGERALEAALQVEGRLLIRAAPTVYPWAALYLEAIGNDFHSDETPLAIPHAGEPLVYRILQAGVSLRDDSYRVVSLFLTYSRSHGRGINFVRRYGDEFGAGLSGAL